MDFCLSGLCLKKCDYRLKRYSKCGEYLGKCDLSVCVYSVKDMYVDYCSICCVQWTEQIEIKRLKLEQDIYNYSA